MHHYTRKEILEMVEEEDVGFIRLQFTDIFGTMKNMAITVGQLKRALDNDCVFDAAAIEGFADCGGDTDLYLYPDLNTFEIFPWRPQQGKVARLICDVYRPDGTPLPCDPRNILKREVLKAEKMGYALNVGPECEFFLFHLDDDGLPTTITHEQGGYFDVAPLDFGENARRDIVLTLEDMGFEIEGSHHEIAPAQHEIDFRFGEAMQTADSIMTLKMVVKTIAKRHGLHATFMPKPKADCHGSGMHVNLSLWKDGKNRFQDDADENGLSREAYYFLGGLLKHMKAITCIANPTVNSYKRFVPGYEAPTYITWSKKAKSPLVRVPARKGERTRLELRSPDSAANPYLTLAVLLAAGMEGIQNQIEPPRSVDEDVQRMQRDVRKGLGIERLPKTLEEAVSELEQDDLVKNVLGEKLAAKLIVSYRKAYEEYNVQVTDWELSNYLHRL